MAKKRKSSGKRSDEEQNPPEAMLPDRRIMERVMREFAAGLGGEQGEETPLDRAQEVMYQAFEATGAEQVRLARKALKISRDCADAYVLLAEHAPTAEEARKLYEQGMAAGERALGKQAFEEHAGYFWGISNCPHDLPPYIRMGGEDEAVSYAVSNRRAWLNTSGAISWLRKTLDLPLPKPPKPRRPAWPELRLALWRLPQQEDEVWQVDAMPGQTGGRGDMNQRISVRPQIHFGKPCVSGTRIPVQSVLELVRDESRSPRSYESTPGP